MTTRCSSSMLLMGRKAVELRKGRERYIQHLFVKEQDTALVVQLLQRINAGEDFDELVVEFSICPSKADSGIIGWLTKDQLDPEFAKVAFEAPLERVMRDAPVKDISPSELHQKMQDPLFYEKTQLIDVREPDKVSQASLPGFQVLPLCQFGTWGTDITTKLDLSKDTYVLCHYGIRSLQVANGCSYRGSRALTTLLEGYMPMPKM